MRYLQEITLDVALGLASWKEERHIVAKQDDNNTRFLKITLLADGQPLKAEKDYTAMFRCLKPDGYSCLNSGTVNEDGTVTVELSNQVLATPGTVKADISLMKDDAVLSTVTFNIQVEPAPVSADTVTSTDEFGLLEELADEAANAKTAAEDAQHKAETAEQNAETAQSAAEAAQGKAEESQSAAETARDNANSAAKLSESWAVGNTGTREGEDRNNSKYYAEQSGISAGQSAASAAESADKAAEAAASANHPRTW